MPSCGFTFEIDYRALAKRREALRKHFIAKGVMDGTHRMDELIRKKMGRG